MDTTLLIRQCVPSNEHIRRTRQQHKKSNNHHYKKNNPICINSPCLRVYCGNPDIGNKKTQNQLERLRTMTKIVVDTGDVGNISRFQPEDATTNPLLIYKVVSCGKYEHLIHDAVSYSIKKHSCMEEQLIGMMDMLSCLVGRELTKVVPGYVSTQVDPRLSYDTRATVERTYRLLDIYDDLGVDRNRILIKLAATWEMMEACRILQKNNINCNMTLILSLPQAVAAAQMKAKAISPFVGHILEWYKDKNGAYFDLDKFYDPGVAIVKQIYNYYKCKGYATVVMGASFRTKKQIIDLAGIDSMTISPKLLAELELSHEKIEQAVSVEDAHYWNVGRDYPLLDDSRFNHLLRKDPMAFQKLQEGIDGFIMDIYNLEYLLYRRFM